MAKPQPKSAIELGGVPEVIYRLRVEYAQIGRVSMLSHLDMTHYLERTVRRAKLPFAITHGFSPHMKIAFGGALPVGVGGLHEIFDVFLTERVPEEEALRALNEASVPAFPMLSCRYIPRKDTAASVAFPFGVYAVECGVPAAQLQLPQDIEVTREKKGKVKTRTFHVADYLPFEPFALGNLLVFCLQAKPEGSLRPDVLMQHVEGANVQTVMRIAQYAEAPSLDDVRERAQAYAVTCAQRALRDVLPATRMRAGEPMSAHTTFQIGGPADLYCVPASVEDVQAVCAACRAYDVPLHVIGCGSNLLVSDVGLRGVVMELGPAFSQVRVEGACVFAQAGATNEAVSQAACAAGLAGYEFASGIPGTVGGAAIMNAGAYDGEFAQVAEEVTCLTPEGQVVTVSHDEACWSYRHSMMDECGYVVLSAKLRLTPDDSAAIQARVDDLTERRTSKQPLEMPSAGSTFKRPEGYFAGKLIQDSGLRGYRIGGAQVSEKHTGFVVNAGGATAADVQALIAHIQRTVREQFGVEMHPEVRMWGF